LRNTSDTYKHD